MTIKTAGENFDLRQRWGGCLTHVQPELFDPAYPDMAHWAQAGVRGGVPVVANVQVLSAGTAQSDIQAALDAVAAHGGGAVVLSAGQYVLTETLRIPSGVVLRGDYMDAVTVRIQMTGTFPGWEAQGGYPDFATGILLEGVRHAGVEQMTIIYDPGLPRPASLRYNEPSFDTLREPYGRADLIVNCISLRDCADCWVQGVRIVDAGSAPLSITRSRHITARYCEIVGAYNRWGGQAYLNVSRSEYCLLAGLVVQDIRHVSIQNQQPDALCRYNVLVDCDLQVDVNFHNGDAGHNLLEQCRIRVPSWHWWGPVAWGVKGQHQPPGAGNVLYRCQAQRYQFGTLPRSVVAETEDQVYVVAHDWTAPVVRPLGPAPRGGTLYAIRA